MQLYEEREVARRIRLNRLHKRYLHECHAWETFDQWLERVAGF